jgi:MFS superfamily sulfate permease-like transporter
VNIPIPAIAWLRAYDRIRLRADLAAGLTTAAVVVLKRWLCGHRRPATGHRTLHRLVPLSVYAVMGPW